MILVSGANGFIGRHLCQSLSQKEIAFRRLVRRVDTEAECIVSDLDDVEALQRACRGVDCVFHCAGYAHAFASLSGDDANRHWQVNFEGTRNLVLAAAQAGVKRFVFLSSVKAMADAASNCADEEYPGLPDTAYGQAKRAAEDVVMATGREFGMHAVNLRLAMVYGKGGGGNLERMGRLVARGLFPPLPETGNHRSLVHVDDVVSAMRLVARDARAAGRTYIVADQTAPSGRELFNLLRCAAGLPVCDLAFPETAMRVAARAADGLEWLIGRRIAFNTEALDRLLGSAWYSPARIERELGWRSQVQLADGLSRMLGK